VKEASFKFLDIAKGERWTRRKLRAK